VAALAAPAGLAIGPERTVDIANKALSPAINDPTAAVLALDQIHRLLLYLGRLRAMLEHLDRPAGSTQRTASAGARTAAPIRGTRFQ
jgi:uncharacterized membrane protein